MARFWIGPLIWNSAEFSYEPPAGVVAWIDVRSPVQAGTPNAPVNRCIFVTANATVLPAGYTDLGTNPLANLSNAQRTSWRNVFGLPSEAIPTGSTLQRALYDTMTIWADPTGALRCLPLVPNGRRYELWLAGEKVRDIAFDVSGPEAVPLRLLLRRIYRRLRDECWPGGVKVSDTYRKLLGFWVAKYLVQQHRWFVDDDLPDEGILQPATTYTDNFDIADRDAFGAQLTWTETLGDGDIVGNRGRAITTGAFGFEGRAEHDLSGNDNSAEATCYLPATAAATARNGVCCRWPSSARDFYFFGYARTSGGLNSQFRLSQSGTGTTLASGDTSFVDGDTLYVEANGSSITGKRNGAIIHGPITNSTLVAGLRGGVCGNSTGTSACEWDNFSMSDLGAPAVGQPMALRRSQIRRDFSRVGRGF